jgi:NAD(P)-dependent dehydrogenase (short-subunit alcohol dehydrogenase family)
MRLHGKVAIITGGGGGLGRETAFRFVKEGACVVIADINQESGIDTLKMIRTELPEYDNCITYYKCDVSKQDEMKLLISYTESVYHKVNIIFNNASIMMNTDKSLIETDDNTFDRTYEVNVKGTFYGCKFGIQALRRAGGGVIINVSSFVSMIGSAVPQIAYTASQGAILSMTKELAAVHAKENIRFIPLCPGHYKTSKMMNMINTPSEKQKRLIHQPMGRFGNVSEIANAVVFLASDDSSYMTGSPLIIDGGLTSTYITPE